MVLFLLLKKGMIIAWNVVTIQIEGTVRREASEQEVL